MRPDEKTRLLIALIAVIAIGMSIAAAMWILEHPSTYSDARLQAAGQIAAIIPALAGVLLAAYAVSAYMRAEDPTLKSSDTAWHARNSLLFGLDTLAATLAHDLNALGEAKKNIDGTAASIKALELAKLMPYSREAIGRLLPNFTQCLFETQLGRAIVQREGMTKRSDGMTRAKAMLFCINGFMESTAELRPTHATAAKHVEIHVVMLCQQADKLQRCLRQLSLRRDFEKLLADSYSEHYPAYFGELLHALGHKPME